MLVDTSVWVDHFRRADPELVSLLEGAAVECHPFVIGELACGRMSRREEILGLLQSLPRVPVAEHHEALAFVEKHDLAGAGIGWIDVHLLASARLGHTRFWTRDRRLATLAHSLGIGSTQD
jgi:predicted nucleic acid-binding protein